MLFIFIHYFALYFRKCLSYSNVKLWKFTFIIVTDHQEFTVQDNSPISDCSSDYTVNISLLFKLNLMKFMNIELTCFCAMGTHFLPWTVFLLCELSASLALCFLIRAL